MSLTIEPLTRDNFAEFGDVLSTESADYLLINQGSTRRYHALAEADVALQDGRPVMSIFRATPLVYPLSVRMMERHPLGSQAFMPLRGNPFLILVGHGEQVVDPASLRLFVSNGRQGVNYARNTWHHPVLALVADDEFLVVDRAGPGDNCEECYLAEDEAPVIDLASLPWPAAD